MRFFAFARNDKETQNDKDGTFPWEMGMVGKEERFSRKRAATVEKKL